MINFRRLMKIFLIKTFISILAFSVLNSGLVLAADPPPPPPPETPPPSHVDGATDVTVKNTVNVKIKNKIPLDLGDGTGVNTAPEVETIPVLTTLFKPLFDWLDTVRNWRLPAHYMQCPKPSTVLFKRIIVMDSHCTLIENIQPDLRNSMLFVYSVYVIFIILNA